MSKTLEGQLSVREILDRPTQTTDSDRGVRLAFGLGAMRFGATVLVLICAAASYAALAAGASRDPAALVGAICEVCKMHNDVLYNVFKKKGQVISLPDSYSACDDHSWRMADSMYADDLVMLCRTLDARIKEGTNDHGDAFAAAWQLGFDMHDNHDARHALVEAKRKTCVDELQVCDPNDMAVLVSLGYVMPKRTNERALRWRRFAGFTDSRSLRRPCSFRAMRAASQANGLRTLRDRGQGFAGRALPLRHRQRQSA